MGLPLTWLRHDPLLFFHPAIAYAPVGDSPREQFSSSRARKEVRHRVTGYREAAHLPEQPHRFTPSAADLGRTKLSVVSRGGRVERLRIIFPVRPSVASSSGTDAMIASASSVASITPRSAQRTDRMRSIAGRVEHAQ
jgi:hypothetical protein